jgi:hypothetical protein
MTRQEIAKYLEAAAALEAKIAGENAAAKIMHDLLHFAAVILTSGGDPVVHLSRLADIGPDFDAASKAADAAAAAKFGNDPGGTQ